MPVALDLPPDLLSALDRWITSLPDDPKPSRPEAIRQILSDYLTSQRRLSFDAGDE